MLQVDIGKKCQLSSCKKTDKCKSAVDISSEIIMETKESNIAK